MTVLLPLEFRGILRWYFLLGWAVILAASRLLYPGSLGPGSGMVQAPLHILFMSMGMLPFLLLRRSRYAAVALTLPVSGRQLMAGRLIAGAVVAVSPLLVVIPVGLAWSIPWWEPRRPLHYDQWALEMAQAYLQGPAIGSLLQLLAVTASLQISIGERDAPLRSRLVLIGIVFGALLAAHQLTFAQLAAIVGPLSVGLAVRALLLVPPTIRCGGTASALSSSGPAALSIRDDRGLPLDGRQVLRRMLLRMEPAFVVIAMFAAALTFWICRTGRWSAAPLLLLLLTLLLAVQSYTVLLTTMSLPVSRRTAYLHVILAPLLALGAGVALACSPLLPSVALAGPRASLDLLPVELLVLGVAWLGATIFSTKSGRPGRRGRWRWSRFLSLGLPAVLFTVAMLPMLVPLPEAPWQWRLRDALDHAWPGGLASAAAVTLGLVGAGWWIGEHRFGRLEVPNEAIRG